jgi:ketosteroid isomerase-like protein
LVDGHVSRALEHVDTAVVWEAIADAPDAGIYRGHAEVRRYMEDWVEDFEIVTMDFEEVIDAGECLVVVQHARTRGKGSGLETELYYAAAYRFHDNKIMEVREFRTRAEALQAAGLGP